MPNMYWCVARCLRDDCSTINMIRTYYKCATNDDEYEPNLSAKYDVRHDIIECQICGDVMRVV